jgi:hypothetical protein
MNEEQIIWKETPEKKEQNWKEGIYTATITKIENFEAQYGNKKRITFETKNENNENKEYLIAAYPTITNTSKMGLILQNMGIKKNDNKHTWNELIGKQCKILLEKKEIDGKTRLIITKTLPL